MSYTAEDFYDKKLFFCVTGCSLIFTEELMAHGGASSFLKGIYCPYDESSSRELIVGYNLPELFNPDMKMVSEEAVKKLATGCKNFFQLSDNVAIITASASLFKENQREGRINGVWFNVFLNGKHLSHYCNIVDGKFFKWTDVHNARFVQERWVASQLLSFSKNSIKTIAGEKK